MPLHRLVTPTYPGGLPGTHDLINNGAVTDAPADGAKGTGDNAGSYFVAFGEDATSSYANRPHQALAQNTDFIDDVISGALPMPADTTVPAGGVVTSVQLTGNIFVGRSGEYTDTQPWRDALIKVVDPNTGVMLLDDNNDPIVVTDINDSGDSDNVIGTEATGFHTDPWVHFSGNGVQSGQSYKLLYAKRGTLVDAVPTKTYLDFLTRFSVDGAPKIDGEVERFLHEASRRSSGALQALVATIIETGGQGDNLLPESSKMWFIVDPLDSYSANRNYEFRFGSGVDGIMHLDEGASAGDHWWGCELGAIRLWDSNMDSVGSAAPHPLTSDTLSEGDSYLRRMEENFTLSDPPSIFKCINARPMVTVGDGIYSFGDFNGNDAIQDAIDYWVTNYTSGAHKYGLHIIVKPGTYTPTASITLPIGADGRQLIIEGENRDVCMIVNDLGTGVPLFTNAAATQDFTLDLRELRLWAASGGSSYHALKMYSSRLNMTRVQVSGANHGQVVELLYGASSDMVNPMEGIVFCDRCDLSAYSAAEPAVRLVTAWPQEMRGFIFRGCLFSTNESPPLEISSGDPSAAASLNEILFEGCRFDLKSAAAGGGNHLTNNGLCELVMGATNDNLTVGDITWRNSVVDILIGGVGTSPVVMYMRTGDGTRVLPVNKVVIDGMKIFLPNQNVTFIPFYIGGYDPTIGAAPNVEEVIFKNVVIDTGNSIPRDYGALTTELGGGSTNIGAYTIEAQNIVVQNVEVLGANVGGSSGDFRFHAFGEPFSSAGRLIVEDVILRSWLDGATPTNQADAQIYLLAELVEVYVNRLQVAMAQVTAGTMPVSILHVQKSPSTNVYFDDCRFEDIKSSNLPTDIIRIDGSTLVKSVWMSDVNIVDVEIDGGAAVHIGSATNQSGIENVFIDRCRFQQIGGGRGVFLECDVSGAPGSYNNPISAHITNNHFYSTDLEGLYILTEDWDNGGQYGMCVVTGNNFRRCGKDTAATDWCVYSKTSFYGTFRDNLLVEDGGGGGKFIIDTGIIGLPIVMAWNQIGFEAYITTNSGNWPLGASNTPTARHVPSTGSANPMLFNAGWVEQI